MQRSVVDVIVDRVSHDLDSTTRHETNWVAVNVDDTEETLTLSDELSTSLRVGTILSVGRELMRVRSVNPGSLEVLVKRGWRSSEAEPHLVDEEILIAPRFTRSMLVNAIADEIISWSDQLFTVSTVALAVTDSTQTVEIPASVADPFGVVAVHFRPDDVLGADHTYRSVLYRTIRGTPAWSDGTGTGLFVRLLPTHGRALGAGFVDVAVAHSFVVDDLDLDTDLVVDVGLDASMIEVVELGVKMRVMGDAENARSARQAQDEPRRAEEVPPGAAISVAQTIRQIYDRRFGDEIRKLQRKWKVSSW